MQIREGYEEPARIVTALGVDPKHVIADSFRIEDGTVFWDEVQLGEKGNYTFTPNGDLAVTSKSAPMPENY